MSKSQKAQKVKVTMQDWDSILQKIRNDLLQNKKLNFADYQKEAEEVDVPECEITINAKAYEKMWLLVDYYKTEVSWNATVKRVADNKFVVEDVFVFPQQVTGATVTTDDDEYREWLETLDDDTFNNLRFHVHSHVNMGVTPSGVDRSYRDDLILSMPDNQEDNNFYIFVIFNKKREWHCEVYDLAKNIYYPCEKCNLIRDVNPEIRDFLEDSKEKVKEKVYTKVYEKTEPKTYNKQSAFEQATKYPWLDDDEDEYYRHREYMGSIYPHYYD